MKNLARVKVKLSSGSLAALQIRRNAFIVKHETNSREDVGNK